MNADLHHADFLRLFAWANPKPCSGCGEEVVEEDLKDNIAVSVLEMHGLCQNCQDKDEEEYFIRGEEEKAHEVHQCDSR